MFSRDSLSHCAQVVHLLYCHLLHDACTDRTYKAAENTHGFLFFLSSGLKTQRNHLEPKTTPDWWPQTYYCLMADPLGKKSLQCLLGLRHRWRTYKQKNATIMQRQHIWNTKGRGAALGAHANCVWPQAGVALGHWEFFRFCEAWAWSFFVFI